jgi:polyisoprenyl-teichoic acid--peptidoglycan teichoic acid transferase
MKLVKNHSTLLMRVGLILIYLVVTVTANFVVFTRVREMAAASEMLPILTTDEKGPSPNVEYEEGKTLPEWTGTERITVLIMGIDERAQWDEPAWRTDTMIVATLDPVTLQAGVLSIPRDLWVEIPGYTHNRINTAHYIGDYDEYPGGGPALAVETVEHNLGFEIDYYTRVNFQAFIDLVDEIGGIDIYVEETIDDPLYPDANYGYDPLYIEAGDRHFDGELALKYARTRHTGNGDFDRARRQQQVILAILEKVTQPAVLTRLVSKAPEIYSMVEASVSTDLKLDQTVALAGLARKVDTETIHFAVIDENCTENWTTPDDSMVLVPIRESMREKRDYIFGLKPLEAPEEEPEVTKEAAKLSILNGTLAPGLAQSTADFLTANGFEVANFANADRQDYDTSLVILNRDFPATAERLVEQLALPRSSIVNGDNPTAEYDIVIILGQNYAQRVAPQE